MHESHISVYFDLGHFTSFQSQKCVHLIAMSSTRLIIISQKHCAMQIGR